MVPISSILVIVISCILAANGRPVFETGKGTRVIEYNLTFTQGPIAPDGVLRQSILINGQFPGPTIRVRHNDILRLNVDNQMFSEAISIHIHGLYCKGTPHMDGVSFGTQRPLPHGEQYTYEYRITNPPGTYWYHSHYHLQSMSAFGAFIIEEVEETERDGANNPNTNYKELILLLSDWYHASDDQQLHGLLNPSFKWVGNPQSLLINGRGRFNCSQLTDSALIPGCQAAPLISSGNNSGSNSVVELAMLKPGIRYRVRIISATALSYLRLTIGGHRMHIIEADGIDTEPLPIGDSIEINSGQRYSVLLERITDDGQCPTVHYPVQMFIGWRASGPTFNGLLRYESADCAPGISNDSLLASVTPQYPPVLSFVPPLRPNWILDQLKPMLSSQYYSAPPVKASKTFMVEGKQANITMQDPTYFSDGNNVSFIKWVINDIYYMPPMDSSLLEILLETNPSPPPSPLVFPIESGDVVDIILQNTVALNGICEQHPWHLHGHHFWDLGGGPGKYEPVSAHQYLNTKDPVLRDSVTLFPYESAYFQQANLTFVVPPGVQLPLSRPLPAGSPCGWRVLRFRADNPGVWAFHCHINAHMQMGMQVFFAESMNKVSRLLRPYKLDPDGQWRIRV